MQIASCKLQNAKRAVPRTRPGGVYIVVLGTAMIVSLLGLAALMGQRIQNRMLTASADITQAQLNADTAVELGILSIRLNQNWRSLRDGQSFLFTDRGTGSGSSCGVRIVDAASEPTMDIADRPLTFLAIGRNGAPAGAAPRTAAEQRMELVVDPRRKPHDCLKNAANSPPSSDSTWWQAVFDHYRVNGTAINMNSLPTSTPNLGRNVDFENGDVHWTGTPPGVPEADISPTNNHNHTSGGTYSLRVQNRDAWNSGPCQMIDAYVKPGRQYTIEAWIYFVPEFLEILPRRFRIRLTTKGTGSSEENNNSVDLSVAGSSWTKITATVPATSWTGDLQYAFIKIAGADSSNTEDFYLDDVDVREASTGRFIYRKVLGPDVNTLYAGAATNASEGKSHGIYWIDCRVSGVNENLYIERSRIRGTLLVLNPGPDSRIGYGPIHWWPHKPGYPALLVDGNFSIRATNQQLSEASDDVNYNPNSPAAFPYNGSADVDKLDQYATEIHGLVGVSGNLTYMYNPQIRGRVIVGGSQINNGSPSITYLPDSLLNPPPPLGGFYTYRYDRRPASVRKAVLP